MRTTAVIRKNDGVAVQRSAPGGTRTPDPQLRRLPLYPPELLAPTSAASLPTSGYPTVTCFTCPTRAHRGGRIRTGDLLLPKQARYRATLRPARQLNRRYPAAAYCIRVERSGQPCGSVRSIEVSRCKAPVIAAISRANARPRWLMSDFSSLVAWANVRPSSLLKKYGS